MGFPLYTVQEMIETGHLVLETGSGRYKENHGKYPE